MEAYSDIHVWYLAISHCLSVVPYQINKKYVNIYDQNINKNESYLRIDW